MWVQNYNEELDKIYFTIKRNIDSEEILISEIRIDHLKNKKMFNENYSVKNIQELKSLLKKILNS